MNAVEFERERITGQERPARRPEDAAYDILKSAKGWQPISMTSGGFRCCAAGSSILIESKRGEIKVSIKKLGQSNDAFIRLFPDDNSSKFSLFYRNLEKIMKK